MKRVLLTGMSGTGKSATIRDLVARGHAAVDLDDAAWSAWADTDAPLEVVVALVLRCVDPGT